MRRKYNKVTARPAAGILFPALRQCVDVSCHFLMTISNKIINKLAQLISGDAPNTPYMTGPALVDFFNECGFNDEYGQGFPTRWRYVAEKLAQTNNSDTLRVILEEYVDPRRFFLEDEKYEIIIRDFNALLKFDGYAFKKSGALYKLTDIKGTVIQAEGTNQIGHSFVTEQIEKAKNKISADDYNGAITNARTLIEAVLIHAIETIEKNEFKSDGNLLNLWSKAKKALKMEINKEELPDFVVQILSGLDTSLNGLAALSNNASDRHANKFKTKRHHAKLALNLSMTLSDFIIDVLNQRKNGS
jgi:hypothetical protein